MRETASAPENSARARPWGLGPPAARLPVWAGYLVTICAEILLTAALDALRPVFPGVLLLIPYILVTMGVAYYFGLGPTLLSIVLAVFSQSYVYVPPIHTPLPLGRNPGEWTRLWFFVGGLIATGWAMLAIRRLTANLMSEIEERRHTEEALRESQHDLSRAQAVAHIGSWRLDLRRNELVWSDETYRIFDVPKGTALTYQTFLALIHPDDREYVARKWQAALHGEQYEIEHRIIVGADTVKWIRETAEMDFDEEGQLIGGFGTAQDITDSVKLRQNLEHALQETQRDRERIAALEGIAEAGLSSQDLDDVLGILVVRMAESLHAHCCGIFILDEDAGEFVVRAEYGVQGLIGERLRTTEGVAAVVYQEHRSLAIPDLEGDTGKWEKAFARHGAKSLLAVPLIARGQVVGMACAGMRERREYTAEEIALMESLAARTALIIDNAQLVETLTHNCTLLQRALLPPTPPVMPGCAIASAYRPGTIGVEIGGDFYDVFDTEDGNLAVIIGDVVGKGIPSASLAAAARSTVHAFAYDTSAPGESLSHTNAVINSENSDPMMFVTLFVAVIDRAAHCVRYAGAGHPPAALYHSATGEVEFLGGGDPPVGVIGRHAYTESEADFEHGDKLVFYTDGLSEALSEGVLFGQEGIERVLREHRQEPVDDIVQALLTAASDWAKGRLIDDTAVIVMECDTESVEQ